MSNVRVTAERGYGSMEGAVGHQRTTERFFGEPKRTTRAWVTRWNYTSNYHMGVSAWEYLAGAKKRRMRGGPILLNRVVLFIIVASTVGLCNFVNNGNLNKYYLISTVFIGLVYVINTIWNWYIFASNGSRIHPHMFYVSDSLLVEYTGEFFEIPIHTRITDQHTLVIVNQISALIAQLIQQNQSSTSIKIMAYGNRYLKQIRFPAESFIVFLIGISGVVSAIYIMMQLP